MPVFATEQEVYDRLGPFFEEMLRDPELAPQLQRADTIVQYRYHDPRATVTVDLRQDSEPRAELGETELEPEVAMEMAADTAHLFFLGAVSVPVAIARREIVCSGPVAKILKLVPLVKPFFPRYRSRLLAEGRADLVSA